MKKMKHACYFLVLISNCLMQFIGRNYCMHFTHGLKISLEKYSALMRHCYKGEEKKN